MSDTSNCNTMKIMLTLQLMMETTEANERTNEIDEIKSNITSLEGKDDHMTNAQRRKKTFGLI
jgi:hypothetical protein